MTEGSIFVPTTDSTAMALDVIAGKGYQRTKISDGRTDGTAGLAVNPSGALLSSDRRFVDLFVTISGVGGGDYSAGDQVGAGDTDSGDVPVGVYRVIDATVVSSDGAELPDLTLGLVAFPESDEPAWPSDGDPAVLGDARVFTSVREPLASDGFQLLRGAEGPVLRVALISSSFAPVDGDTGKLRAFLSTPADITGLGTADLLVTALLEYLGPLPS